MQYWALRTWRQALTIQNGDDRSDIDVFYAYMYFEMNNACCIKYDTIKKHAYLNVKFGHTWEDSSLYKLRFALPMFIENFIPLHDKLYHCIRHTMNKQLSPWR